MSIVSTSTVAATPAKSKPDIFQTVTDQIVAMLEQGVVPWQKPWQGGEVGYPRNLASGKKYRGVNVFLLAMQAMIEGYESPHWVTFKQAKDRGGSVRKGEKSTLVVFWKRLNITETDDAGQKVAKVIPVLRHYRLFNVEQCEGFDYPKPDHGEPLDFHPIEAARAIVEGYQGCPTITHICQSAHYAPKTDTVNMPKPETFSNEAAYYNVIFHELTHSTGHAKRLGRFEPSAAMAAFGSSTYSREELVAEFGAAFLCGHAGIVDQTIQNSAAYIDGWLRRLKNDKKLAVQAAAAAQKAADHILGVKWND